MNKKISVATWNVNSIRARLEVLSNWVEGNQPDILLLQETKCQDVDFPMAHINMLGYNASIVGQKSYNGVAILSKYPINVEKAQLPLYGENITDNEARYIEAVIDCDGDIFRVASVYVPNGSSKLDTGQKLEDSPRFQYKLSFLKRLHQRMQEILHFDNEKIVFGGDYNVAQNTIDLFNPEDSAEGVGFHSHERQHIANIVNNSYKDIFRHLKPDSQEYTWWDYRRGRWHKDEGWRIDYLLCSESVVNTTEVCRIHKDTRSVEKASDHVPVEIVCRIR